MTHSCDQPEYFQQNARSSLGISFFIFFPPAARATFCACQCHASQPPSRCVATLRIIPTVTSYPLTSRVSKTRYLGKRALRGKPPEITSATGGLRSKLTINHSRHDFLIYSFSRREILDFLYALDRIFVLWEIFKDMGGEKQERKYTAFGSTAPYAEPLWYSRNVAPQYGDSHRRLRAEVRRYVDEEIAPFAFEWETKGKVPDEARAPHCSLGVC